MGDDNIVSLGAARAARSNDNTHITPAECLEEAAREIRAGEQMATAVLVLLLDDSTGCYGVNYRASNLRCSEMLALLEVMKARCLADMGFFG